MVGGLNSAALVRALIDTGFLEVRMMARKREIYLIEEDAAVAPGAEPDHHEQIRMIADVCHGLAGALSAPFFVRNRRAAEALAWRWSSSGDEGRRWIVSRLRQAGPEYVAKLEAIVRHVATPPGAVTRDPG
ncbi:hypothetical protein OG401_40955 [Kitasatospora purpeofusca]|uniref:hypothetical protein n=1 Tax=Kitasatospora purpeofusca TaxID=67352 RepID=UPI0022568E09|nr:hypothetical protein [Kitasatospora purpeofusca]MCX4690590.1 hypothetical protein [Kitasatospora purpeofusca]